MGAFRHVAILSQHRSSKVRRDPRHGQGILWSVRFFCLVSVNPLTFCRRIPIIFSPPLLPSLTVLGSIRISPARTLSILEESSFSSPVARPTIATMPTLSKRASLAPMLCITVRRGEEREALTLVHICTGVSDSSPVVIRVKVYVLMFLLRLLDPAATGQLYDSTLDIRYSPA